MARPFRKITSISGRPEPPDSTEEEPSPDDGGDPVPRKLSPEWLAAMLVDVTAHLMNAIDKAARLREPLERIADAAESRTVGETPPLRRDALLRGALILAAFLVLVLAVAFPLRSALRSRFSGVQPALEQPAGAVEFTLGGVKYHASRATIEQRLLHVEPEPVRKYCVVIDGRQFPVKQAVAVGLGALRADFGTDQAIRILRRLGFEPQESPPPK